MRPSGCWSLKISICSSVASKLSPVWTMRNSGWCSCAYDDDLAIDKLANDRRLANLLKLLVVLICLGAILQRVLPLTGIY